VIAEFKKPRLSLYINEKDQRSIGIETLNFKVYEKNDSHMIYGILKWLQQNFQNPIFFDVGANEGIYTISAAIEGSRVHAFEAAPETYKRLNANLKLNSVTNIRTENIAVSDETGTTRFIYCPEVSGSSSFKNILDLKESISIEVDTITLDEYCERNSVMPNFVKIDVEGAELKVIKGFVKGISSERRPILFVEILRKWSEKYGYKANDLMKLILDNGYSAYVYEPSEGMKKVEEIEEMTVQTNFLFLPTNIKHSGILEQIAIE
tara:strand:- start:4911 stop:5702 length:792 start_codon:yes stop_codon:yes gene_type:complete